MEENQKKVSIFWH